MITLYILGGCVAAAALLFVIMIVLSAMRPPKLPDITSFEPPTPIQRVIRALTPPPVAIAPALPRPAHVIAIPPVPVHAMPTVQVVRPPAAPTLQLAPAQVPSRAASPRRPEPGPIAQAASHAAASWAAPHIAPVPHVAPTPLAQAGALVAQNLARPVARGTAPPPIPQAQIRQAAPMPQAAQVVAPAYPHVRIPPAPPAARAMRVEPPPPLVTPTPIPWAPQPVIKSLPTRAVSRPSYPKQRARWGLRIFLTLFVLGLGTTVTVLAKPSLIDPLCDDYEWFGAEAAQVVRDYAIGTHEAIADFIRRP